MLPFAAVMTATPIRDTKSLSPVSLKPINATVVQEDNGVYLIKTDEDGQEHRTLIEKDPHLYLLLTQPTTETSATTDSIYAYVSSRCNLHCKICYEGYGNEREAGPEEIAQLRDTYPRCKVALMGKEPTCREDLTALLDAAGTRTCLLTNGVKLRSLAYVRQLKAHGLRNVFFSFNGLNDEVYQRMNGASLLRAKLDALNTLEREHIDTVLSATIARHINTDQILPLVEFCFPRRSFIYELRIRSLAPVGRHLNAEQLCMSELIDLVASSLHVDKADILKEFSFVQALMRKFERLLPRGFRDRYGPKLCSFLFHVTRERDGTYSSPGSRIDLQRIGNASFTLPYLLYYLVRAYGWRLLAESALGALHLPRYILQHRTLTITLKCWPTLYNVDLNEMTKCPNMYYKDGELERFCVSNIKHSAPLRGGNEG
jgi:MoaA/NifB/PqqE/SkfB family radical SAM enzyme